MCDIKQPKLIEMDKKYTFKGHPVRILCVDKEGENSVVALYHDGVVEVVITVTKYGRHSFSVSLEEVSPYAGWKMDDAVLVSDYENGPWYEAHFSHVEESGVVVFPKGMTSWTIKRFSCMEKGSWWRFGKKLSIS
jgi:hypothetical protein